MGKSTEELNTELESSRQQLSRNIDELNDKVNPQRVIRRRKDATASRLGSLRDRAMGTASDTVEHRTQGSPLAAGLVAFGTGMLLSALIPASDKEAEAAQRAVDAAREHGQPMVDDVRTAGREMADNLKDNAAGRAEQVKSSAQGSVEAVKQEGQSSTEQVKEETRRRR